MCSQAAADDIAAIERKAADGDATALFALGDMYERGDGVPHDMVLAAAYMQLAAEHGSAAAQYRLGLVEAVGLGVEANVTESYKWLNQHRLHHLRPLLASDFRTGRRSAA